jgi:hypothetical protein
MRLVTIALTTSLVGTAAASPHRDIDGDGFDDTTLGHTTLFYGSATGLHAPDLATVPQAPRNAPVLFFALDVVGDVNGDGFADVMFGDPACPSVATDLPECAVGGAYLYLGGPKRLAAKPVQAVAATDKNTLFGMQVVALGDINGDHLDDVAIPDRSGIHVYLGAPNGLAAKPIELPGSTVFAIGDVDHDGRAELLTVAPQAATVFYGGDPKRSEAVPHGKDAGFVASGSHGDFDGDGFGDLAITVEPKSPTGAPVANAVVIYRGSAKGLVTSPAARLSRGHARASFGSDFAAVGDLDGDRRDDLVIVASCSQFDAKASSCDGGTAHVYLGGARGLATRPVASLKPVRTNFGLTANTVSAIGDADGDGHPDFAFGAFVYRGAKRGIASATPPSL